ncbi:MAG: PDZ domain-containing protein [Armatimonadota bacterium]
MQRPVPALAGAALAAFALAWLNRNLGEFASLPAARSAGAHAVSLLYLAAMLWALIAAARAAAHIRASTPFLLATGLLFAAPMLVVLKVGAQAVPPWLETGANNLFGPVGAVLVGAAIGRIINHPNTLLAAAGFAAFFDLVVVTLGPVAKLMEANSPLIQAVSVGAGAAVAPAWSGFGKMIPLLSAVTIGPADVLFLAVFLGSVVLLGRTAPFHLPTETATRRWMFGLLFLALVLVEFGVRAVPALAPMGVAVIAANLRHGAFTRTEKRDLWIGGAFALACAALIVFVGPKIAARNRPAPPKGPIYGFVITRIPPAGELVVNGVAPDSPSWRAGLKPGDVIDSIEGVRTPRISDRALGLRVRDRNRLVLRVRVRRLGAERPLDLVIDAR